MIGRKWEKEHKECFKPVEINTMKSLHREMTICNVYFLLQLLAICMSERELVFPVIINPSIIRPSFPSLLQSLLCNKVLCALLQFTTETTKYSSKASIIFVVTHTEVIWMVTIREICSTLTTRSQWISCCQLPVRQLTANPSGQVHNTQRTQIP